MAIDNVLLRLKSNFGDDYIIETLYRDDQMGVYVIFNKELPKKSAVIQLHNIVEDVGTAYTFGKDHELEGKVGLPHLSDDDLLEALGQGLYEDLQNLINDEQPIIDAEIKQNGSTMRLAEKVQDWLNYLEWDDNLDVNSENATSQVIFNYTISEQNFNVYVETDEQSETIRVFIYAPFRVLPKKQNEFALLLGRANAQIWSGAFIAMPDGKICWRHFVNFANTDPSPKTIDNMFQYGVFVYSEWFEELSEVALTNKSAQDVFDRLDAEDNE